jgi:hypothetical protein
MKTKPLYKLYEGVKPLAVWVQSAFGGIEMLDRDPDDEMKVIVAYNYGTRMQPRRHKVYTKANGDEYILMHGTRYNLSDAVRI